jgi:membrane protein DedA with SNARE-associated domain
MINVFLLYFGLVVGGILGMFLLYTVTRLCFKAIFRSYFEERDQHLTRGEKDEER